MLQLPGNNVLKCQRRCIVGKMAVAAENTLLKAPRAAGVVLEHFHIVIGFKDKHVGGANALNNEPGGMAKIGQNADIPLRGSQ